MRQRRYILRLPQLKLLQQDSDRKSKVPEKQDFISIHQCKFYQTLVCHPDELLEVMALLTC